MADPAVARLARNTSHLVTARLLIAGSGLVLVAVVYDAVGPEEFGVWVALSSVVALVALIDLGLSSAAIREVAAEVASRAPERAPAVLGMALLWAFVLAPVAAAVTVLTWPWFAQLLQLGAAADTAMTAALVLILGGFFAAVELPWRAVLEGAQEYAFLSWVSAGTAVAAVALSIVLVRLGAGLAGLAVATATAAAARMIITVGVARARYPEFGPDPRRISRDDLGSARRYGLPVQVSSVASGVNVEFDRLILTAIAGPAVAGAFEIGTRLLNLMRLVPGFALMALFPIAVSGAAAHGRGWLDRLHVHASRSMSLLVVPMAAVLIVCADPLIQLWLGDPVPWAATNLAILIGAYTVNLVAGPGTIVARAEGRPGLETRYVMASVVVNLALTPLLIWRFGPVGVPIATAVAVSLATGYFVWHFHTRTGRQLVPVLRSVWPPVAAAALGAGVAATVAHLFLPEVSDRWSAAAGVVLRGAIVVAVVLAVLWAARFFDEHDRWMWRRLRRVALGRRIVDVRGNAPVPTPAEPVR